MKIAGRPLALLVIALMGCGPVTAPTRGTGGSQEPGVAGPPKTLTVASLNALTALGDWSGSAGGGALTFVELHSNSLVTTDREGVVEPRLAARLPSLEDGTVSFSADGRMHTTWKLRPNVKWHDGAPLTADDLEFAFEVYQDRDIPLDRGPEVLNFDRVQALDPLTLAITYKTTFYQWARLGIREFWPLPKHLLGEAFRTDRQGFTNLPYWTAEYVHLGPFRVVDFGMGESTVLERFDDYFLGRPKLDRIFVRSIPDANALTANLRAGAVDIVAEYALPDDLVASLRTEWERTGEGTALVRQGQWNYLMVQFNPELGRPPELSRDVRIRRGLFMGLDRQGVREVAFPGLPGTDADSFLLEKDPRGAVVGRPFARYPYDPSRAAQELEGAGWRRGADGRVRNASGDQVQIPLNTHPSNAKEMAIVAQSWRDLGITVQEDVEAAALIRDREYQAKFPGLRLGSRSYGDRVFAAFDSRQHATAENRYTGTNLGGYRNAGLDRLIDRLYSTIDDREQGTVLKELGEIAASDLPALPVYYSVSQAVVRKGVRALFDDYAGANSPGFLSRNAHLWDRE